MSEFYIESDTKSKDTMNRYKNCKILKDVATSELLLSIRPEITIARSNDDIWHRVKINEVCRLDLLAYKYYNNALYWWIIADANNIYNPLEEIAPGTLVRIPSLLSLYGTNGILL